MLFSGIFGLGILIAMERNGSPPDIVDSLYGNQPFLLFLYQENGQDNFG